MTLRTVPLALLFLPWVVSAASTPAESLLVLSKGDHTLSIVDPKTRTAIARMPSGPDPHEVIASSDGKFAFISNYGGSAYNSLTVANLITQKWAETIDLGPLRGPHGLAFADRQVWFTAEGAKAIGRYDLPSRKVDWILGTGQNRTHMIYISRDLKQIITTNVSSATVSVIDSVATRGPMGAGRTDWNETVVSVGRGSEGFDVSPDRTQVWVANAQDGTISVVDLHDRRVVHTLDADVKGANRLKFTPDGKLVFVSTLSGANVSVFDSATRRPVKRIPVGHGAAGIEVQPDGSRVYVSCTPDNYVAIIDPKSLAVLGHIEAGKQPDGLAWAIQR